jgi:predicted nucleotidyltransferase
MQTLSKSNIAIHPITQKTLDLFAKRVKEHEGDNLLKIILLGSVARGEANKDSDIDVLVILKESTYEKEKRICHISANVEWDMGFNNNSYLQEITLSEKKSKGLDFYSLMFNINKEGVILYNSQ